MQAQSRICYQARISFDFWWRLVVSGRQYLVLPALSCHGRLCEKLCGQACCVMSFASTSTQSEAERRRQDLTQVRLPLEYEHEYAYWSFDITYSSTAYGMSSTSSPLGFAL